MIEELKIGEVEKEKAKEIEGVEVCDTIAEMMGWKKEIKMEKPVSSAEEIFLLYGFKPEDP